MHVMWHPSRPRSANTANSGIAGGHASRLQVIAFKIARRRSLARARSRPSRMDSETSDLHRSAVPSGALHFPITDSASSQENKETVSCPHRKSLTS